MYLHLIRTCLLNNIVATVVIRLYCLSKLPSDSQCHYYNRCHSQLKQEQKAIDFSSSFILTVVDLPCNWLYKQDYLRVLLNMNFKTQILLTGWSGFTLLGSEIIHFFSALMSSLYVNEFGSKVALGLSLVSRKCLILDEV